MTKPDFEFYRMMLEEESLDVYTDYELLAIDIYKHFGVETSAEELKKLDNEK
jgi:hypothetical protein